MWWLAVDAPAGKHDLAVSDLGVLEGQEAGDGAQCRGLARPVGPYQRDDGAVWNFERDALDRRRDAVIDNFELTDFKEIVSHRSAPHGIEWPIAEGPAIEIGLDAPPDFGEPFRFEQ